MGDGSVSGIETRSEGRRCRAMVRRFLAGLLLFAPAGCSINPVSGLPEVTLVTTEQEKTIGEEEAGKVARQMGLLDHSPFVAYLDQVGHRLAEQSPRKNVAYQFHLVDAVEPNAFALPGGYVYVTRGLLPLVNSEDELAGVVGHEIGHVAARHSVQKISRQGPFAAVFGIVSGITGFFVPAVGDIIGGVGDFAQSLVFSPYSRSQETEADRVGQEMAARAGWDPAALSAFLTTLGRDVELMNKGPRKPSFFDSHPATPDRVAKTTAYAKELTRAGSPPISPSPEAFLARLDGLVVGQRAANGLIRGRSFFQPDLNFYAQFPEQWQLENSPERLVAAAPDEKAAIVLGIVAKGTDPLEGARAVEKATKSADVVSKTQITTINGQRAAHLEMDADRGVKLDLTWIARGGQIYQIVGLAPAKQFDELRDVFHAVAHSFRPLSESERAGIKEMRLRLVTAQAGETIQALKSRTGTAWSDMEIAVANALTVDAILKEGQWLKVAIEEPYAPGASRE